MEHQAELEQVRFIVDSVLLGTMPIEALIDALEIIDGLAGQATPDAEAVMADIVDEDGSQAGEV